MHQDRTRRRLAPCRNRVSAADRGNGPTLRRITAGLVLPFHRSAPGSLGYNGSCCALGSDCREGRHRFSAGASNRIAAKGSRRDGSFSRAGLAYGDVLRIAVDRGGRREDDLLGARFDCGVEQDVGDHRIVAVISEGIPHRFRHHETGREMDFTTTPTPHPQRRTFCFLRALIADLIPQRLRGETNFRYALSRSRFGSAIVSLLLSIEARRADIVKSCNEPVDFGKFIHRHQRGLGIAIRASEIDHPPSVI